MYIKNIEAVENGTDKLIAYTEKEFCGYAVKYILSSETTESGIDIFRLSVISYGDICDEASITLGAEIKWAMKFFDLISENLLMPCNLKDVYDDYIVSASISV